MKKTFLFFFMAFLMSWYSFKAQGLDYIIMLDNGSSVTDKEYAKMKLGAVKLMEQLWACRPDHRIAVVQYGTGKYGETNSMNTPVIYIESDFTSDHFTAQNFERRLDFGDHLHESLGIVSDALDGNSNTGIISNQTILNNTQPLRVIVFTDAERNLGGIDGSYLVNFNNTTFSSPQAFLNVLKFKNERYARFTVIHANASSSAKNAAAVIATPGGNYLGPVEPISGDPESMTTPRLYYNRPNGFEIVPGEMNFWKEMAKEICDYDSNARYLNFQYEPHDCIYQPSNIGAHYYLPPYTTLVDFKLDLVSLETGNVYPVGFNPTFGSGDFFSYQFQPSDFDAIVNAGSTGLHKFRMTMNYLDGNEHKAVYSWNNYPYFDHDIDMDCVHLRAAKTQPEEKIFKLTPNPTNGLFSIVLTKEMASGKVEVRDLTGNLVYHKQLRNEKQVEVNLSSRKEGIYIVNVITDKNETFSEKIIKK
ncbi:T9SS type A sorting domain-containing protein [Chryseobacterium arthrosphaerae]|uniref:Secretion system C-terminal sorting domain-containing protein n=1 Tax=Chryseobacterium arthrosphaerae TaxID=651561 RepID=A0A1B8ZNG4_9FLAO|nr:T9SS type A sorting domain-containing protein [Chryseobacterium arthrosphaerae]OCA73146.1 hypothetical protein BBI00_01780 [Chryseobacterium arthrosphaerae]